VEKNADNTPETTAPEPPSMTGWNAPACVRETDGDVFFQDFKLHDRILRALLEKLEFRVCTPVQSLALSHTLAGRDLAAKAQTGTGKTAAFLITILQRHLDNPSTDRAPEQPMALVIAPTRELVVQINHDAEDLGACSNLRSVAVYGGMHYDRQREILARGVDLVVATPGRLLDYASQGAVDLSRVEVMVLDEADRMLDMGFIPDVKRIMGRLPAAERRQTLLFSATLSQDILRLARRWMREDPVIIEVDPEQVVAEGVDEIVYAVASSDKLALLLSLARGEDCTRMLIFRNRRRDVEELHNELQRYGVPCSMLSGDVPQKKRLAILEAFRAGEIRVIVATDVAGRGIHVEDISHVVNYDLPYEAEDYVHRIGRTGRAGSRGKGISFAGEDCAFVIPEIEKYIDRELPIQHPTDDMLVLPEAKYSRQAAARRYPSNSRSGGNRRGGGRDRRGNSSYRSRPPRRR
jgi:ATP-dependent RNA helicase RhlB